MESYVIDIGSGIVLGGVGYVRHACIT